MERPGPPSQYIRAIFSSFEDATDFIMNCNQKKALHSLVEGSMKLEQLRKYLTLAENQLAIAGQNGTISEIIETIKTKCAPTIPEYSAANKPITSVRRRP